MNIQDELENLNLNPDAPPYVPPNLFIAPPHQKYCSFNFKYHFNPDSGEGLIENAFPGGPSILINVDHTTQPPYLYGNLENYNFALGIIHKHFLPVVGIDNWTGNIIHIMHTETFESLFRRKDGKEGTLLYLIGFNGRYEKMTVSYVAPFPRRVIKSIISFIGFLHQEHKVSIRSLAPHNLVVLDGVLKLCMLEFMPLDKNHDYELVATFILTELFEDGAILPPDFQLLIQTLRNPAAENKDGLKYHLSIMSPSNKLNFFKSVRDAGRILEGEALKCYLKAIHEFRLCENWVVEKFTGPHVIGSHFSAVTTIIKARENTYDPSTHLNGKTSYLRCCRNCGQHLGTPPQLPEISFDVWMTHSFGQDIIQFQSCLAENGILYEVVKMGREKKDFSVGIHEL